MFLVLCSTSQQNLRIIDAKSMLNKLKWSGQHVRAMQSNAEVLLWVSEIFKHTGKYSQLL